MGPTPPAREPAFRTALLDWLACAAGGWDERAARAARAAAEGAAGTAGALAAAGHVLDFDDTFLPGVAHLSAATAPAALAVGARTGATVADVLAAYADGFEVTGALAGASHPALYDRGLHPTAVCGTVGAAAAGARLLGLDGRGRETALGLAALRATGTRGGFGSDGKALGVALAAAEGVRCAELAAAGARLPSGLAAGPLGFAAACGGTWAEPDPERPAIAANWIKPWPCCLMAHAPIEAALAARAAGEGDREEVTVRVHPLARQAAAIDAPADGLQAKFSIPYLVALALRRGPPRVGDFREVDTEASAFAARHVRVVTDEALGASEARLERPDGAALAAVAASEGSPGRPLSAETRRGKTHALAGARLDGALDDPGAPAAGLLRMLG